MINNPDQTLIEAASKGDKEAIEQLLLQYHPTITRFARKFCATPEDVEDAVQETLWIAARKIGTLRVTSAFASWLFQVVRRQCYRLLNMSRHEDATESAKLELADSDTEFHIALQHDVVNAIARLSSEQRQVLIMRDIESMTAPAVAAALGITVETVKSRLHRARNSLRQSLSHWNE